MTRDIVLEGVELENGMTCELGYHILTFNQADTPAAYGIRVEKSDVAGITSSEETFGLTHSYEEAEAWLQKLAAGRVTPLTLHDIVDDW